jgi:pilus assembly protein TadC
MKRAARYGMPAVVLLIGCVVLFVISDEAALVGVLMIAAFASKVIFLGEMFRVGLSGGNQEREDEEAARRFLGEHGHWPEDVSPAGPAASGR